MQLLQQQSSEEDDDDDDEGKWRYELNEEHYNEAKQQLEIIE